MVMTNMQWRAVILKNLILIFCNLKLHRIQDPDLAKFSEVRVGEV